MESRRVRRLPTPLGERFRVPHSSHSLNSLRVDRANTDPKPQHGNQGEIAPSQGYIFDVSTILSRVTFLNGLTGGWPGRAHALPRTPVFGSPPGLKRAPREASEEEASEEKDP